MEEYIKNYDKFDKHIIFNFSDGGIGDLTWFFTQLLKLCINNSIKLRYLVKNTFVEKYLRLKCDKMYITYDEFKDLDTKLLDDIDRIDSILQNNYYIVNPRSLYEKLGIDKFGKNRGQRASEFISFKLNQVFYFTDEVILNIPDIFKNDMEYISIHLRLGDKWIEPDLRFNQCPDDSRTYNDSKINNFIFKNKDKNIFFTCDNRNYKNSKKCEFEHIIIEDYDIGHTSFLNTTEIQTLNTLSEFYLLSKSKEIYMGSGSGFPIAAANFNGVPIYDIDDL